MTKSKQTTTEPIAVEGYVPVAIALILALWAHYEAMSAVIQIALFAAFFALCLFFRNPERISLDDANSAILAPSDGFVESVDVLADSISITIHTKLQDVHLLRAPIKSILTSSTVRRGAFLPVDSDKAALLNESYVTNWKSEGGYDYSMSFTLGSSPAKIALYLENNTPTRSGARIAFVRSEVKTVLALPKNVSVKVAVGTKVFAGRSVLGYINEPTAK